MIIGPFSRNEVFKLRSGENHNLNPDASAAMSKNAFKPLKIDISCMWGKKDARRASQVIPCL